MNYIHFKVINRLGCLRIDSGQGLFEESLMISMSLNLARIHKQRQGGKEGFLSIRFLALSSMP